MTADEQLNDLFDSFATNLWRWECQGDYPVDAVAFQAWRDGKPVDRSAKQTWVRYIRRIADEGKTFGRVRMLTEPLTEYLRWLIEQTQDNLDAGETIRWITQSDARRLKLPPYDFYLVDDQRVAIMRFGGDKLLSAVEMVDDPAVVDEHRGYRSAAVAASFEHAQLVR